MIRIALLSVVAVLVGCHPMGPVVPTLPDPGPLPVVELAKQDTQQPLWPASVTRAQVVITPYGDNFLAWVVADGERMVTAYFVTGEQRNAFLARLEAQPSVALSVVQLLVGKDAVSNNPFGGCPVCSFIPPRPTPGGPIMPPIMPQVDRQFVLQVAHAIYVTAPPAAAAEKAGGAELK